MAQIFNPEIIQKIFTSLSYFRVWIIYAIFPFVILVPDIAINFIQSIYFPSPTDIIIYNEIKFKEAVSSLKSLKEVVDPFADEKILKNETEVKEEIKMTNNREPVSNPESRQSTQVKNKLDKGDKKTKDKRKIQNDKDDSKDILKKYKLVELKEVVSKRDSIYQDMDFDMMEEKRPNKDIINQIEENKV